MWHLKGERLYIPTPGKNVRVAVCGAFRYPEGPFLATFGPKSVNTALFISLLHLLSRRVKRTRRIIILVLDNARYFRKSKRAQAELENLSERIIPFWLPKYTSEKLNRIENVWTHLKDDYFSRMLVTRRNLFASAAVKLLKRLNHRGALKKLFGKNLPT
jgi:transposase